MSAALDACPACGVDLRGPQIPPEDIAAGYYGPSEKYFSRTIGVEVRGVYDGVLFWNCPDCGGQWHRWPEGHRLRAAAEKYMYRPAAA